MVDENLVTFINVTAIPLSLFLIMFGMGLTLALEDFRRVTRYPKAVTVGLTNQLLILPLIGILLAFTLPLSAELAVGLILVSVCPGGINSNLFTHLSRGDVALSITLTAVASVVTIFTIPFIVNASISALMGADTTLKLPVITTVINLVMITLLPITLGMIAKHLWPRFAHVGERLATRFAIIFLITLVCYSTYQQRDILADALLDAGVAVLLLNVSTMAIGYISARMLRLSRPQQIAVTLESGLQNSALAIMMALTLLSNYEFALTPGAYSIFMFFTAGLLAYLVRQPRTRNNRMPASWMQSGPCDQTKAANK